MFSYVPYGLKAFPDLNKPFQGVSIFPHFCTKLVKLWYSLWRYFVEIKQTTMAKKMLPNKSPAIFLQFDGYIVSKTLQKRPEKSI